MKKIVAMGLMLILLGAAACGEESVELTETVGQEIAEESVAESSTPEVADTGDVDEEDEDVSETLGDVEGVDAMEDAEELLADAGDYRVYRAVMSDTENIKVFYPRIEGLDDTTAQRFWNQFFEQNAEAVSASNSENDMIEDNVEVTYLGEDMISLIEYGYFFYDGAAHPYSYAVSYNLDLTTGKMISLPEMCDTRAIAECLLSGRTSGDGFTIQSTAEITLDDVLMMLFFDQTMDEVDVAELEEQLDRFDYRGDGETVDEGITGHSYWQDGSLNLVFSVNHALGDYVVVTMDETYLLEE